MSSRVTPLRPRSTVPAIPLKADLTVVGSPVYSADVANANSSLSLQFNGSQYAIALNSYNLTTNFGVEAWVKPSSTGTNDRYIVYSGDPASSGWGIVQRGATGQFQALFGGRTYLGTGTISVGQWTHLAFVCTATNATFYVNGVQSDNPVAQLRSDTDVTFAMGADAVDTSTNLFQGNIDEVRVFAFADGEFVPTDLLYTVRPLALALQRQAGQSTLTWPEIFPQYGVESATDLTATNGWTPFSGSAMAYDQFSITDTNNHDAQFYRLSTMTGLNLPPALPAGQYVVLNDPDAESSFNITHPNSAIENIMIGSDNNALDASGFVDLSIPNGTVDDHNFHWVITYPGLAGTYSDQGITGYFSPVLQILPNSLANASTFCPHLHPHSDLQNPPVTGHDHPDSRPSHII